MSLMDILKSYAERPTDTHQDFDEVARQVPAETLAGGLADAFRSDRTPDFGQMVSSLFRGSNAQQRSGLLQQLASALGPSLIANVAGGLLGRLGSGAGSGGAAEASDKVSPDQVREIAAAAEKQDPTVMDRIGAYYAQHPEVVKVLGGTALAVALGHIAGRMRR
jgi:hypothetical protein